MPPKIISPFVPFFDAWSATRAMVGAQADVVGKASAQVLDQMGLKDQATYMRTTYPHNARVGTDYALTFLACGGNPAVYAAVVGSQIFARGAALGMFSFPLGYRV